MRNLFLAGSSETFIPQPTASSIAFDIDEDIIFLASEHTSSDGPLEINIHRTQCTWGDEQIHATHICAHFETTPSSPNQYPQILSTKFLPEGRKLVIITRNGDISTTDALGEAGAMIDVEGTVEPGITSAQWSPDDSLLVLTTMEDKVILMTSTFDVLSEASLYPSEFGDDSPVNVGWGSKQTQFHGSLGKGAAQAPKISNVGVSPDDDGFPRISWRGDGAFYVISSLSPSTPPRRTLRVYDTQGKLQSTSEDLAGLEHVLSWRPSGNLIACTQRFGFEGGGLGKEGRHDIIFFERNGLRHGEFSLPVTTMGITTPSTMRWGYKVKELLWSPDSDVLAVWLSFEAFDIVQLWTIGNYHWYLKHEVQASIRSPRFTSISWHPEKSLHLVLTSRDAVMERKYAWDTVSSTTSSPTDSGTVAVIDGANLLLTPFRSQNIPPPMSSCSLRLTAPTSRVPTHLTLSSEAEILGILWEVGYFELWDLKTRLGPGRGDVMRPGLLVTGSVVDDSEKSIRWRQISFIPKQRAEDPGVYRLALLGSSPRCSDLIQVVECSRDVKMVKRRQLFGNGRLIASRRSLLWQSPTGQIMLLGDDDDLPDPVASFPQFSWTCRNDHLENGTDLYFGLAVAGKLYAVKKGTSAKVISSNTTSITVASGFLIFTTTAHEVLLAPLDELSILLDSNEDAGPSIHDASAAWTKRRVERGSRIVVSVPSAMSLVLQMPRGNLETINPRPLVLAVVKKDLDGGSYRKAFSACRKHRIDLHLLVDHNRQKFLQEVSVFIDQLDDVDDINLFLANIGRGSSSPEAITEVCDAVRFVLEKKNLVKFVNSVLTAYVMKTPPDHESGLSLLLQLRNDHSHLVEDAVKYIIFLVDVDSLYNTALGMYDFSLVLMIAQHSQKDPREYLPFLRELRALSEYRQKFKIDDMLKRYSKALTNLSFTEEDNFDEALAYVEQYQLYEDAIRLWHGSDKYSAVLNVYGDWFFDRHEYRQASAVYIEAGSLRKAMVSQERALDWQDLFDVAYRLTLPEDEIHTLAYRISEELASKRRHADAARVLLDYANDVSESLRVLVQGNLFSEARRLISYHSLQHLVEECLNPGLLESQTERLEEIREMRDQLTKQVDRIQELRIRKKEEPKSFYGVEDTALHNVDVMTDASMPLTAFTRYTAAPTTASRTSRRTSKSRRKLERKAGSGRKGTVDEEEYLLKSITKLVMKSQSLRNEISDLLPHLLQATTEHKSAGRELQDVFLAFETHLKSSIDDVWKADPEPQEVSWISRLTEPPKNPRNIVPLPILEEKRWQLPLFSLAL